MGDDILLKLVGNIGVPAVICLYTLLGVNKTIKELTTAINKQTQELERRGFEQSYEISALKGNVRELSDKVDNVIGRSDTHELHGKSRQVHED